MNAIRDQLLPLMPNRGKYDSHPGLLLQRYLHESAAGDQGKSEHKRQILDAAIRSASNGDLRGLYEAAFARWSASIPKDPAPIDLTTQGRLIVGLGSENVIETGIRLHHTYGMPIIPGSALKGLAAHFCDQVWGPAEEGFRKGRIYHQLLFGTTDDSGCITFHDAWLTPKSPEPLRLDVMTPHHPKWLDGSVAPTDFDSPIPIPFLSVTGDFRVAVSWHGPTSNKAKNWSNLALSLLRDALEEWGIGGKTTSGYGRLILPPPPPPPPPPKKRASGAKAKVHIIASRPKGGFEVQDIEPGRAPGSLTVGTPTSGIDTNPGAIVDVLVHVDEPKRPQYKWPQPSKK